MLIEVDRGPSPSSSADQLARALSLSQRQLAGLPDADARRRRALALDECARYLGLLREAMVAAVACYSFKLEFPDGRWSVAEQELLAEPRVGDLVEFSDGGRWRIRGSQFVCPQPLARPWRAFFVCAPAA
jgi:hypothetical protein